MKGHDQVIAVLNDILTAELTATNQYYVHARMCENWGYDLDVEKVAIKSLNSGIELCRSLGDNGSRELLEEILKGQEVHANWLEAQLTLIEQVGDAHYLAQQITRDDS